MRPLEFGQVSESGSILGIKLSILAILVLSVKVLVELVVALERNRR
jgi:hypothetical protein